MMNDFEDQQRKKKLIIDCNEDNDDIQPSSPNIKVFTDNRCTTEVQLVQINYSWRIENFPYVGDKLISNCFKSEANDKLIWQIKLSCNGWDEESKEYLSVHILLVSSNKLTIPVKFEFCIENAFKIKVHKMKSDKKYVFSQGQDFGFNQYIKRDYVLDKRNRILVNNALTIICTLKFGYDTVTRVCQTSSFPFEIPESEQLSKDMRGLLVSNAFSDLTIVVGKKEYHVHKAILTARSSVFKALIKQQSNGTSINRIELKGIEEVVSNEMIHFIYTGKCKLENNMTNHLLGVAERYALDRLKLMCEETLSGRININNAAEMLILSDKFSADKLKSNALHFIHTHAAEVMDTVGWKLMVKSHPVLLAKAYEVLVYHKQPSITKNVSEQNKQADGDADVIWI